MKGKRPMKAQFFLLGAFIICMMFFAGMSLIGPKIDTTLTRDISLVSDNLESEFPRALNLGISSGKGTENLMDFTELATAESSSHYANLSVLWIISDPQGSSLNLTVGNYIGHPEKVSVTISGEERDVTIPADSVGYILFPSVLQSFPITIGYANRTYQAQWSRDKANLYLYFQIQRGSEILIKELHA